MIATILKHVGSLRSASHAPCDVAARRHRARGRPTCRSSVQIPRLDVAEYHRPYVAVWIENPDQSVAAHSPSGIRPTRQKEDGTQWLKDLRQWWRRGGRELQRADRRRHRRDASGRRAQAARSSATDAAARGPGAGKYDAGRRSRPRSRWPRAAARAVRVARAGRSSTRNAQGKSELGAVTLDAESLTLSARNAR